jgi:hypothetical protein
MKKTDSLTKEFNVLNHTLSFQGVVDLSKNSKAITSIT